MHKQHKQKIILKNRHKEFHHISDKKVFAKTMKCKNCKSKKLIKVVKLGKQPISSVFIIK